MDVVFYDLDFNKLHILPPSSKSVGFKSMDTKIEFNGEGSFELEFWDVKLERLIRAHPDGMLVRFGDFEGITTDYQFSEKQRKIFGSHLNGMLNYEVFSPVAESASKRSPAVLAKSVIDKSKMLTWVNPGVSFDYIDFKAENYQSGYKTIQSICKTAKCGYKIYADWAEKKLYFKLLKSNNNPLMLSEKNLNAYQIKEDFDSKDLAFGGWWKDENKTWHYIDGKKTGLKIRDTVLKATNETEAKNELEEKNADYKLTAKTRNIEFGKDYLIGDIVRIKHGDVTDKLRVESVDIWQEGVEFGQEPTLKDYKEEEDAN